MRALFIAAMLLAGTQATFAQAQTSKFGIPASSGSGGVQLPVSTVAQLPVCDVSHTGMQRFVTDANSTTYNAMAAGGSTNKMTVACNGTNWVLQ